MYIVQIPKLTDEELLKRYAKIRPIVSCGGKKYFLREFSLEELKRRVYIGNISEDKAEEVNMKEYESINADFECLHKYGYHGFFNPFIAEVLCQIKDIDVGIVDAFEIIELTDFNKNKNAFDQGYHSSIVRLYCKY